MKEKIESLGISNFGPWYFKFLPNQDVVSEVQKTIDFVNDYVENHIKGFNKKIQFINYGSKQLVFVVFVDDKQYALIVNQPATLYGLGRIEFNNLNRLNELCSDLVIRPCAYYCVNNKELYMTPYHYQSRCVGIETDKWGMWVPEPDYHFVEFNDEEKTIINTVMVASLVRLYDEKLNRGLSCIRLDGGDFMLDKDFEKNEINIDNIVNSITLIAARSTIKIDLDVYLSILRKELSGESDDNIIIGKKLEQPFSKEEIEEGIKLGLMLREEDKKQKKLVKDDRWFY